MTGLELFAGALGAGLGLHRADVDVLAHVEWDQHAAATARTVVAAGLVGGEVIEGDVREVDLRPFAGVDLMWASFPCQAFSTAGKRLGAQDERNGWPWTVDALDVVEPEWFIGENVTGLLSHSGEHCGDPQLCPGCYTHRVILPQLRERFAWVDAWTLDAADVGVPQHRRRVFLVAGPGPVKPPRATHGKPSGQVGLFRSLKPWRTVREALGLGGGGEVGSGLKGSQWSTDRPSPTVRDGNGTSGIYIVAAGETGETGEGRPSDLVHPAPTIGTKGTAYFVGCPLDKPSPTISAGGTRSGGGGEPIANRESREALEQALNREGGVLEGRAGSEPERLDMPSPTVTAQEVKGTRASKSSGYTFHGGPDRASDGLFLATGRRRLTTAECALLQDFPADWPWQGTKTAIYRQIGNAVPPTLAEVVARQVVRAAQARRKGAA